MRHIILRLGQLAADCPQLAEIEINPLRVFGNGRVALHSMSGRVWLRVLD